MKNHSEYLQAIENELIEKEALTPEIIEFYKKLYDYHLKYFNIFMDMKFELPFLSDGAFPMVHVDEIAFTDEVVNKLSESLSDLCDIIKEYQSGIEMEDMLNSESENDNAAEFIKSLLAKETEKIQTIASDIKIGADELIFIILNWMKPLFVALREKNAVSVDMTKWLSSSCPFCGYLPDMAKLEDSTEGKRFLHCTLCEAEWPFERLACTVCDNKDFDKLGYYVTEDENPYRIDYCENCNGYIKTIRINKAKDPAKIDLAVENVITLYLDKLAMEQGLSRP